MARYPLFFVTLAAALVVAACSSPSESSTSVDEPSASGGASQSNSVASSTAAAANDDFFDQAVVHSIEVQYDEADYDAMIATYVATGEKEWIEATVTIDGETYEHVGLRLKGNSSLGGLRGRGAPGGAGAGDTGTGAANAADSPQELPWLIRLDEFVEGQNDSGRVDIVIRSNNSQTSLNEALALDLLEAAGLASQEAVSTSFTVNGSDTVLRLAIEHPDEDAWQDEAFEDKGALYKAESTGNWSYRGDDPNAYIDVFDQEGGKSVADMTPLIEFLDFINNSSDEAFAEELPERLDVDAFARYLAMMDLLSNFDDIDGPGNNSYLWYDPASGQFTVVPWDMNLTFGVSMGGGGGAGGFGQAPDGATRPDGGGAFPGRTLPGGQLPDGETLPNGQFPGGANGGRGGFGGNNPLVTRFHANTDFEALYLQQLTELRTELFDSGLAQEFLDARVATLKAQGSALVDAATVDSEAAALVAQFETP